MLQNVEPIRVLGSGANAKVKSCYVNGPSPLKASRLDLLTLFVGWICAMKEIDLYFNQQTMNETALMRKLPSHPNFVQYFAHRVEGNKLQIFLKQYSGTLRDLINQRQESQEFFSPEEILAILLDISAGLRFLHKEKVIHRGMFLVRSE